MKISALATLAMLLPSSNSGTDAFSPPRPPVHHTTLTTKSNVSIRSNTALQLDILGTEVDASVLAAAGLALVGGIGAVVLKGQIDATTTTTDTEESAPSAAAPVVVAPTPAPEVVAAPAMDSIDISIPYDAAAKKAYEEAGSPGDYQAFKTKFESDAVAEAIAKKNAREAAKA